MATEAQLDYIRSMLAKLGYSEQFALAECFGAPLGPVRIAVPYSCQKLSTISVGDASVLIDWLKEELG